jgi:hypothetical protein
VILSLASAAHGAYGGRLVAWRGSGKASSGFVDMSLRSRTLDDKGIAQPMPRPFQKSGHAAIESVDITVKS